MLYHLEKLFHLPLGIARYATLGLLLLAAGSVAAQTSADVVQVMDARARSVPAMVPNSAAYMTLSNVSEQDQRLVAAHSQVARTLELHEHINDGGVMRMRQVEGGILIPAKSTVMLKPGGYHVMLIGLTRTLEEGSSFSLELEFADGGRIPLMVPVETIQGMMKHHAHH
jgi:copper(I)-binding protein